MRTRSTTLPILWSLQKRRTGVPAKQLCSVQRTWKFGLRHPASPGRELCLGSSRRQRTGVSGCRISGQGSRRLGVGGNHDAAERTSVRSVWQQRFGAHRIFGTFGPNGRSIAALRASKKPDWRELGRVRACRLWPCRKREQESLLWSGLQQLGHGDVEGHDDHERVKLQFRTEVFNVFNRTQFDQPGNLYQDQGTFGFSTETISRADGTTSARQMQFGLKFCSKDHLPQRTRRSTAERRLPPCFSVPSVVNFLFLISQTSGSGWPHP